MLCDIISVLVHDYKCYFLLFVFEFVILGPSVLLVAEFIIITLPFQLKIPPTHVIDQSVCDQTYQYMVKSCYKKQSKFNKVYVCC